jgi:hypothetical protein
MALRIAFDIDGVLADMEGELVRQAEIIFGDVMTRRLVDGPVVAPTDTSNTDDGTGASGSGPTPAAEPTAEAPAASGDSGETAAKIPPLVRLQMSVRQQRRLWHHVETIENFWETLTELEPGAIARLGAVARARQWEVIFLTKRPESAGDTAQVQTQRWLESKGFPLPSVYVVQGSRGRIADALGLEFVIDDRPENCLDVVVDSKARAVLVWREDENQLPAAARRLGIGVVKSVGECIDILVQLDAPPVDRPSAVERVMRLLRLKQPTGA